MRNKLAILSLFFASTPLPLAAQQMIDVPIWSNGILGQSALRNTYDNYNRQNGIDPNKAKAKGECSADALPAADKRKMEAEYMRRARADGKASADAWVREQGRRFHMKLVADGICPAPADKGRQVAETGKASRKVLDKDGKPCSRTRLENRPIANVGGGAMSLGLVPVCAD